MCRKSLYVLIAVVFCVAGVAAPLLIVLKATLPISSSEIFEAELSQRHLEEVLNKPIETFAWTFGGKYSEKAKRAIGSVYSSAWNFLSTLKVMPDTVYDDLRDITRLHEQVFLPEMK